MKDPYDYIGRDGRGNDKLWHEEDDEDTRFDDLDDDDAPDYDDMMSTYDDQFELED